MSANDEGSKYYVIMSISWMQPLISIICSWCLLNQICISVLKSLKLWQKVIVVRRSDNAKEFLKLTLLLGSYGINHRPAYSQTHEQIGKVERRHHNISRHRAVITSSCWTAVTVGSRLLINSIRLLEQLYILLVVEVVSIVSRISMFFFKHLQFSFGRGNEIKS